jgi:hypothetical protein
MHWYISWWLMNAGRHATPGESIQEQPNVSQLLHHYTKRLQGPVAEHAQCVHCRIWCPHGSMHEDHYLLGCYEVCYFTMLSAASNGRMIYELERIWKETVQTSACTYWGKERKTSARTAGVPAEIRSMHLSNTGMESFRYTKQLAVTPCNSVDRYRRFGGTYEYCLHFQGRRISCLWHAGRTKSGAKSEPFTFHFVLLSFHFSLSAFSTSEFRRLP